MVSSNPIGEYSDLIRLSPDDFQTFSGCTFISASTTPPVPQLCRELTLARGRILYEVFDEWNESITGYVVPASVAEVVSQYERGLSTEAWNSLPLHRRNVLKHAHRMLDERFPRMSSIAAIRVAERAEWERWNGEKMSLEEKVVDHVRHEWTSYEVRLEYVKKYDRSPTAWSGAPERIDAHWRDHKQQIENKKEHIREIIKPRMREVLRSWLPQDISEPELGRFWRRHSLYVSGAGEDGVSRGAVLQNYAGLETIANLVSRADAFS